MRLIDADATRKLFDENLIGVCHDVVIKVIDEAPTIEPKQGEWIDRSDGGRILNPWWENYECNRCGYYGSGTWNFCPHCGARMKGADDE